MRVPVSVLKQYVETLIVCLLPFYANMYKQYIAMLRVYYYIFYNLKTLPVYAQQKGTLNIIYSFNELVHCANIQYKHVYTAHRKYIITNGCNDSLVCCLSFAIPHTLEVEFNSSLQQILVYFAGFCRHSTLYKVFFCCCCYTLVYT